MVDNASGDDTPLVIERAASERKMPVRWARERRRGQTYARNRGVLEATGRLLLFTDDDVVVRAGWADALVAAFEDASVGAVGGRIVPVAPAVVPAWLDGPSLRPVALEDYGPAPVELRSSEWRLPFGANFAVRRDVVGPRPFATSLGHVGRLSMGWDEWHLLEQVEATHRIAYAPEAVVEHHYDASRLQWPTVRRVHFQNGYGLSRHRRLNGAVYGSLSRRTIDAIRAYRDASALRRRNVHLREPTAEEAREEFDAYWYAGERLDAALQRTPRFSEWLGAKVT